MLLYRNRVLKPASTHACNGVNYGYLRPINCCVGGGLASSKTASLVLLNVRSLRNKGDFIIDYISEHDIDVMCLTETCLTANDESLMPSLIPAGYGFRHLPRSDRRGGGVGVMFKSSFQVSKSIPWLAESFECLQLVLTGANVASTLRIFIIYRPPSSGRNSKPFNLFLEEFLELIEHVCSQKSGLVILCDFNVHYGSSGDNDACMLADILHSTNFQQHVSSATHCRGNILDLVITPSTNSVITDVSVESLMTDHHAITCGMVCTKPRPLRGKIKYRKFAAIDNNLFAHDLNNSTLVTCPATGIAAVVNKHAPIIQRTIHVRARQPWRTDDLQQMRQETRRGERRWRRTRLVVHREIYTDARDAFKRRIASAKSAHYCAMIESSACDIKSMYRITNDLMGRVHKAVLPKCGGDDILAERFIAFFADKITVIRTQLAFARTQCPFSLSLNVHACNITEPLFDFQPASIDDICGLIMKSSNTVVPLIDTITGPLLKYNVNTLAPVLTRIVNSSIETSLVPCVMKHAVVTPLLKKTRLDPENMMNYRPISNLSFVSKLLEKHVATQVRQHLEVNALFDVFQSAYRPAHSCETALVRIQDDILQSLDNRKSTILVLLDLLAVFDTVDHQILLDRLHMFVIRGNAHKWMQSYLSQRSQVVNIRDTRSRCVQLPCGVPQGSVLGPLLFSISCIELSSVFESHQLSYHIYADDSQLYVEFPRDQPAQAVAAANRLSRCITDVRAWLLLNNLMLNRDKTEAIVIAAVNTRAHATVDVVVDVCGCIVTPTPYVRDIGVLFDSAMSMAKNVSRVCQMAYCQLRSIARIRRSITTTACRTIVHALVMSRLDYCNAVLYGLPDAQLQKLQLVQNAAARLVTGTHRREHITPVLFDLHWLPIRQRIQFKLLLLVYRCIHQLAPAYLMDLVVPYVPARSLRSAEQNLLTVKRYNLERFGRRSFSVAGPSLWNALPSAIRNSISLSAFRSSLKTHLFREAFVTLL